MSEPRIPHEVFAEASFPYAYHQAEYSFAAEDYTGKMVYAQDSQRRHVAIKATRIGTNEYRVLQFLHEQGVEVMQRHCILPVLELLHYHDACFAVMPRWGERAVWPRARPLSGVLLMMQSVLKALTFLHSNNIVHRDLNMDNVLVNFSVDSRDSVESRRPFIEKNLLIYALIDFDLSIMVPLHIKKEDYRLPWIQSWVGTLYPADTLQAEFDYDPFAFDVGTLGVAFANEYQGLTTKLPMLAPFLDRMVTRDINRRFTAAQALDFLNDIIENATEAQLAMPEDPAYPDTHWEDYDRWKGLPADFQAKWAEYREPLGIPLSWKIIPAIRDISWLPQSLMPNIGWFFFKVSSFWKGIWRH